LTIINICGSLATSDPASQERVMPIAVQGATRNSTADTPGALSGRWLVDPRASHARFLARTLAGLVKTPGQFRSLSGNLIVDEARTAGLLVIESSSIDTGNRMRDRHLRSRDFFDAERHPHLLYEVHTISRQDQGTVRVEGDMIVAGRRTPLHLDVALTALSDGVAELACRTEVDRLALGIRGARAMVPRTVELDIHLTLRRERA
jgi:polyisoprenoid-binding protein YceI